MVPETYNAMSVLASTSGSSGSRPIPVILTNPLKHELNMMNISS